MQPQGLETIATVTISSTGGRVQDEVEKPKSKQKTP